MQEIMIDLVNAVPIYGVCPEGYIKHAGYPVLDATGNPVPGKRGASGMVADPDGSEGLVLYAAFLPRTITHGHILPLGRTFAQDAAQAVNVFCSFPAAYPKIEFYRARLMRVVSDSALRMNVMFPQWVMQRALGRMYRGTHNIVFR